jgi:hypothetical protein
MSLQPPNLQDYIERIALTLEANLTLFPTEGNGESLVTAVVRNKPAIIQSAENNLIPYILVFESDQPIRFLEKAGRDGRNAEGGSVYELEIYCVVITNNELTAALAQQKIHVITQAMRTALANNQRLATPGTLVSPLCRTTTRYEVPYLLKGDIPATMVARNVVVRPQVYVSPRVIV